MTPDPLAIATFLSTSVRDNIHIVTIAPDDPRQPTHGFHFGTDASAAAQWASQWNAAGWNIYWTANIVQAGYNAKPSKLAIEAARWIHVDVDPPSGKPFAEWDRTAACARLQAANPSFILDTGGGFQALWRLDTPRTDQIEVEAVNRHLTGRFEGDACWNIDRLLRLPGTINYPNAKKAATGRVPTLATVARPDTGETFAWPTLVMAFPPVAHGKTKAVKVDIGTYEMLMPATCRPPLTGRAVDLVMSPKGVDLSDDAWAAAGEIAACGYPPETIMGILMNPENPVSAHMYKDGGGDAVRRASRTTQRAWAEFSATNLAKNAVITVAATGVTSENDEPGMDPGKDKNSHLVIEHHIKTRKAVPVYNEFTNMIETRAGEVVSDAAIKALWFQIRGETGIHFPWMLFQDTFGNLAWLRRYHPVRDYLDRVQTTWDRIPRLDRWLIDIAGANDTPYVRAVGALFFLAGAERARNPGVKFDELVVLEGPQGLGKSSLLAAISPRPEWFTDNVTLAMNSKELLEQTVGKWIIEAPELSQFETRDWEHLKTIIARQHDRSRLAYDRQPTERGRGFIWGATTNAKKYLGDKTGNRRFWPVRTGTIDVARMTRERDQLWAEAAIRQAAGCSIRLHPSLYAAAEAEQDERMREDLLEEQIRDALRGMTGRVRGNDILQSFGIPTERRHVIAKRFGEAMSGAGWENKVVSIKGEKIRFYVKGDHSREIILHNGNMTYKEPELTIVR